MIKVTIYDDLRARIELQYKNTERTDMIEQLKALQMCVEVQVKKYREKILQDAVKATGKTYEEVNGELGRIFDELWESMDGMAIDMGSKKM